MKINENTARFSSIETTSSSRGKDITFTLPGDSYRPMSGTSMATPSVNHLSMLLLAAGKGSPSQVSGAIRHDDPVAVLTGKVEMRSDAEYLKLDAQKLLADATSQGTSVLEQLERRRPVQDEMPLGFESDGARDKYFQGRLNARAQMVEALQALESEPGYCGPKTDWSSEKSIQLDQLNPTDKAAFYAKLDTLNQAYYGKVIAQLG